MTRRRGRILVVLLLAGIALAVGVWLLLPWWLHGTVERLASRALGREVRIDGPLHVSLSSTPRISASALTLANVSWGSEPVMARVGRVTCVLELASLWSGPVRVRDLAVEDARLLLETDAAGGGNWTFASDASQSPPPRAAAGPPIDLARAAVRGLEIVYLPRPGAPPVTVSVQQLDARLDTATRWIEVQGGGRLDATPWEVSGRLGPLDELFAGRDIDQAITGHLGESRFEIRGRVRDPLAPGAPGLAVNVEGPDIAAALGHFGLRSRLQGAFKLQGRFTPDARGVNADLAGDVGGFAAKARGVVSSLTALDRLDAQVEVSGPDAAQVGAWIGVPGLPPEPFDLAGRVLREAGRWSLRATTAHVGATTVAVAGEIGAPPGCVGMELAVQASGQDLADLSALARTRLPHGPFEVEGRLLRRSEDFALDAVELRFHGASITASGSLGQPPRALGLALTVAATGHDLAQLSELARVPLPGGPFALRGRLLRRSDDLALEAAELRFRDALIQASGSLGAPPRALNLALTVAAAGPDLARFSDIARVDLPAVPFTLGGRLVRPDARGLGLEAVVLRAGPDTLQASGRVMPAARLAGSDLTLRLAGPDLGTFATGFGLRDLPTRPFDVGGRVRFDADGYGLHGVTAAVGSAVATLDGHLAVQSFQPGAARLSAFDGTRLAVRIEGPALADLGGWGGLPPMLPAEAFRLTGDARVEQGVLRADRLVLHAGRDTVAIDGALGALPDLARLDLAFEASGPSAADLGRFVPAGAPAGLERLPAAPYTLAGRAHGVPRGYALQAIAARVGDTALHLDGILGGAPGLRETDLRFDVAGPDTALLSALAGIALANGPLAARGRIALDAQGLLYDGVAVSIGETRAELTGRLGPAPDFEGSDFRLDASGPDLAATLRPFTGPAPLPSAAFAISAAITGGARRFVSRALSARLGANDLAGSLTLSLPSSAGARPYLEADLRSRRLDAPALLAAFGWAASRETAAPAPDSASRARLLSDEPLPFDALRRLDASVRLEADAMAVPGLALRDVVLAASLRDGALRVERVEGVGAQGGRAAMSLTLEPRGVSYRIRATGRLDGSRLVLSRADSAPQSRPTLDVEFDLAGEGRSLREIAARGAGNVLVVLGAGKLPKEWVDHLPAGVLHELLDALNPFRKSSDQTAFECGVLAANVAAGRAVIDPIAARTDSLTVIGHGGIDLAKEEIDLSWVIKPRQGLGLSATALASSYIKLGGTLASPRLDVKPLSAAVSTGAAVATAGLTLLSKQLYNRLTAERAVCADALAQFRRKRQPLRVEP